MSTFGLYFRETAQSDANSLRSRLNGLAESMCYIAQRGPSAGQGNLAALLVGIDAGEVALVLLPDEQRSAAACWLREQAAHRAGPLAEALCSIAGALEDAAERERAANAREIEEWAP